jgi:hypothetical protein
MNTNKLELKYLVHYLPYKVKVKFPETNKKVAGVMLLEQ